jgi:hypothetical protein
MKIRRFGLWEISVDTNLLFENELFSLSVLETITRKILETKLTNVVFFLLDDSTASEFNTLRTASFKLFKRPFPGFLTILTL